MSLLMDALRKAEEAKRAAAQANEEAALGGGDANQASASAGELTLEPLDRKSESAALSASTSTSNSAAAASRSATRSSASNAPPNSAASATNAAEAESAMRAQRQSIHNAFSAKSPPRKTAADRAFIVALGTLALLGLIGIGFYVWLQLQPRSGVQAVASPPPTSASGFPAPQAAGGPSAPAPPSSSPLPSTSVASSPQRALPPAESRPESRAEASSRPLFSERKNATRPDERTASAASATPNPIRITQHQPRVNPLLEQGYAALEQGRLPEAQQAYARMLANDPRNLDALYGLAAIAVARQQTDLAGDYYARILAVDPRDAVAQAGLAGLGARAGSNAESRLKTLIAEQPDSPQLHFALGNVYAQNQRWREAQQAYFLAYKNDSSNPDIAFNLAVSLDQLHQPKLAAQYYAEALRLNVTQPATFARKQAQRRLVELQETAQP